jgi:hypothetical protein
MGHPLSDLGHIQQSQVLLVQPGQGRPVYGVVDPAPIIFVPPGSDQASPAQDTQVVGDQGLGEAQDLLDLTDTGLATPQESQYLETLLIGQSLKGSS